MGSRPGAVVAPSIISSGNSGELNGVDWNCCIEKLLCEVSGPCTIGAGAIGSTLKLERGEGMVSMLKEDGVLEVGRWASMPTLSWRDTGM